MKTVNFLVTMTIVIVLLFLGFTVLYAQVSKSESNSAGSDLQMRSRPSFIRKVDFHLRDGRVIYGKLIHEDKNRVTLEQIINSKIIVTTYSKRDIDARTLQIRNVPEYKYYADLAEHFAGRTWDFKNDPDDFIQAIRAYEKAKQLIEDSGLEDSEKIEQYDLRIKQLKEDRDVWKREAQSRAKLRKLEFEATIEETLDRMQNKFQEYDEKLSQSLIQIETISNNIEVNNELIRREIEILEEDIKSQLRILEERIERNRDELFYRTRTYYPRYYYYSAPERRTDDN